MELGESGKACLGWSLMLLGQSLMSHDTATAQQELDQSITLLQEAGETWRFAIAVLVRGHLAEGQKDLVQARELFNKSLTILQDMGDTMTSALPMQALGRIFYYNGEYGTASVYLQRALKIHRTWEKDIYTPEVLGHLGAIALIKGNNEQATEHFDERLSMTRELMMNKANIANALCDLGIALGHLGNYVRATAVLREGLELSQEIGNTYLIAGCLTGLASIQQQSHYAAQILAAAQAAFEQSGEFINPLYRVEHERTENKIRELLDAKDFAKLSAESHAMTAEQAIALALDIMEKM
jgi:tetratricopeptide (TPR) repeat protein